MFLAISTYLSIFPEDKMKLVGFVCTSRFVRYFFCRQSPMGSIRNEESEKKF